MADVWLDRVAGIDLSSGPTVRTCQIFVSLFSLDLNKHSVQSLRSQLTGNPSEFLVKVVEENAKFQKLASQWPYLTSLATDYLKWCKGVDPGDALKSFDLYGNFAISLATAYSSTMYGAHLNLVVLRTVQLLYRVYGTYQLHLKWLSGDLLLRLFNNIRSDRSVDTPRSPLLLPISTLLLRSYFALNRYGACGSLVSSMPQAGIKLRDSPMAYQVEFRYWLGRYYLFKGQSFPAFKHLSWAFGHCHPNATQNQREILKWMIVPALLVGLMPKPGLVESLGLEEALNPIIYSLRTGVRYYDASLNHPWIIERHLRPILETGLPLLVCRRAIFRLISMLNRGAEEETVSLPIKQVNDALKASKMFPDSLDESLLMAESVSESLITSGYLKANLMPQSRLLRLKRQGAMPSLYQVIDANGQALIDEAWLRD